MSDDLTPVEARYQQIFQVAHFTVEPQIAGAKIDFLFEGKRILITLPPMPENLGPGNMAPTSLNPNPFELRASLSGWNSTGNPLWVDIDSMRISIPGLHVEIPKAAAKHPHINTTLFNDEQRRSMDEQSDRLYHLANRAMEYWLRVVRWKTQFHLINRVLYSTGGGFDGGALINAQSGTRFYTPRVGRTFVMPPQHVVTQNEWTDITLALGDGTEPPIWYDYFISAKQRMEEGDTLAAILDLAIASEARIRTFMNNTLPSELPEGYQRTIRRVNISDVMTRWQAYGLPNLVGLNHVKMLFEIRNGIMHSGKDARANAAFFATASKSVVELLDAL
jgi:hypothetical protein